MKKIIEDLKSQLNENLRNLKDFLHERYALQFIIATK